MTTSGCLAPLVDVGRLLAILPGIAALTILGGLGGLCPAALAPDEPRVCGGGLGRIAG